MYEPISYEPTEKDIEHIREITDFFEETGIPYTTDTEHFGIFRLNDGKIEVRYVNSYFHPMDNSKRYGEKCKGIPHDYFIRISHENIANEVRTIWIFDFEMEQANPVIEDGKTVMFRRQWEVIKNTIRTATGHIRHRFFARDCEVVRIDNKELRPFLEKNCFYGYRSSNVALGLKLKKEKHGFPKGTLLMVYTFGYNFYGNKKRADNPFIEIIRVSTLLECQVIGGASKCLTHFFRSYKTLTVGTDKKEIPVKELKFYVDASHNDGRAMVAMGFNFVSWEGCGFMNRWTVDYCSPDGKLKGKAGEIFHRKPMFHKQIMQLISEGKIVSIANAGTAVYETTEEEFLACMRKDVRS